MSSITSSSASQREAHPAENSVGGSSSKKSTPKRPPRNPSYLIRRVISKSSASIEERTRSAPAATLTRSESSSVKDGRQFHVRVTLGYLKAVTKTEKQQSSVTSKSGESQPPDTHLLTAFASLDPESVTTDQAFAPSLPLSMTSDHTSVVWPRRQKNEDGVGLNKSHRRLYFSIMLQKDDVDVYELRQALTPDDDVETTKSDWNDQGESYAPELVKIQLGLTRGNDVLKLGVATLVITGNDVSGKQMDLPISTLLPGEDDESTVNHSPVSKSSRRRKGRFFGGKKSKVVQDSFATDEYQYGLTSNAILRVRLDVSGEITALSGPVLWGDGDDDDIDSYGSYGSIVVIDNNEQDGDEAEVDVAGSNKDYESIEVVKNTKKKGTTIISAPALKQPEPALKRPEPENDAVSQDRTNFPISSVLAPAQEDISPTRDYDARYMFMGEYSEPSLLETALLCGKLSDTVDQQRYITEGPSCSVDFDDSSTIATSQYKGTQGEKWKVADKSEAQSPTSSTQARSLKTVSERSEESHRVSGAPTTTSYSQYSENEDDNDDDGDDYSSIGDDTVESLHAAKRVLQRYAKRAGVNLEALVENLELESKASSDADSARRSIGDKSLESIFEAKALLQDHADRVGVEVEDLLNADGVNAHSVTTDGSIIAPQSKKKNGPRKGDSSSVLTPETKSTTKSRFSLFLKTP